MALHLLKLAVGATSVADIEAYVVERLKRRGGETPHGPVHTTRMVPKRADEILDGGSLYWVVRGQIAARQAVLAIRPFTDAAGIGRCDLVLDPTVVAVAPRPCRAFQGWRYLAPDAAPADLSSLVGGVDLPEALRRDLAELCLL